VITTLHVSFYTSSEENREMG